MKKRGLLRSARNADKHIAGIMKKKPVGKIPPGIRLLTLSTSVRWIGWGFGEAFIPIFLYLFSTSLLEAGMLASAYEILFFLSIPIAGYLADNIRVKRMILASMIIYIFIGLGYFLAGVTSAVAFVIFARALNGISFSLDRVGRETYFMRHVPKSRVSRIFGHFDLVTVTSWVSAVLVGLFLVKYIPIHWLLFMVAPTSLIALLIVLRLKEKHMGEKKLRLSMREIYGKTFREIKNFGKGLKLVAVVVFFFGFVESIVYFFVPIITYIGGEGLVNCAIIAVVYSIPAMFGDYLGAIADKRKEKVFLYALISTMAILACLIFVKNYFMILGLMFFASIIAEIISLARQGMIARFSKRSHIGEIDGALNGITSVGSVLGPILFGLLADAAGLPIAFSVLIVMIGIVTIYLYLHRKNLQGISLKAR